MNPTNNTQWSHVRTSIIAFLVFGCIFLIAGTFYVLSSIKFVGTAPATNTISVTGHGETYVVPDIAEVTFSVEKTATTVAQAQAQVTTTTNGVLDALASLGISKDDMQTTSYNVDPKYDYPRTVCTNYGCPSSNGVLTGYTVSDSVQIKIHNLDNAGAVLAKLGTTGVTNLSGLNFSVENQDKPKADARTEAINKAKDQANTLAKELGVSLVRITNFSENANYPIYYAKAAAMDSAGGVAATPNIPAGQDKITSDVTITYEIK